VAGAGWSLQAAVAAATMAVVAMRTMAFFGDSWGMAEPLCSIASRGISGAY
jgi:hypothetical protein